VTDTLGKTAGSNWLAGLLRPAAAGAAGYFGAPYLQGSLGIESDIGQQTHRLGTAAAAAALASPRTANLWRKDITGKTLMNMHRAGVQAPVGNIPNVYKSTPIRGALSTASIATAPSVLASATDHTKNIAETAAKTIENNHRLVTDPGGFIREQIVNPQVDRVMRDAKDMAPHLLTSLGTSLGGGLAGAGGGYLLGSGLSKTVLPDDENLPYETRRRRERLRMLLSGAGAYGGALGGSYLANRFQPALVAAMGK
jgi:hypothetical protein